MAQPNTTFGSGIGDFLSLSDTPTLRNKYYDTLGGGLEAASQPAEMDQGAALWQGIVPALAVALMTKGESLGFTGAPLLNVAKNQQELADRNQKLDIEAKLKGAGILGEELGRRETLAVGAANKEEDREQRALQAAQSSDDRRYAAELAASTSRGNAAMMADARRDVGADRDAKAAGNEENTVLDDREREVKPLKEKAAALNQIIALAAEAKTNPESARSAQGMILGLAVQASQGASRVADKDITLVGGGKDLAGYFKQVQNFVDGGMRGVQPTLAPESIAQAARVLGRVISKQYLDVDSKYKKRADLMRFGNKEEIKKIFDMDNPLKSQSQELTPAAKFKIKDGSVKTLEELRKVPGWNDAAIERLERVE